MLVPCLQYRVFQDRHPLNVNVSIEWLATNVVVFPLAGYFLNCRLKNFWTKKRLLVLWGINIVAIVISCYMTYYRARITGICNEKDSQMFFGTFVLVNCVAIFATCQYLNSNTNILFRLKKPIVSVGGCTFGIYLIHVYFKNYTDTFKNLMSFLQDKLHSTPVLASLIYCVVLFMCGYVVTLIMKKIPLLRKIVS
jgi:peptidoglycan/LPS O-acetylase OafA/YrhL